MRPEVQYQLPRCYEISKPCVYKLSFEGKYVIIKAKDHISSINVVQRSLNQFLNGSAFQRLPHGLYFYFFTHVEKKKKGVFSVDCLLESESAYELLKAEQIALDASKKDKNCLNNATQAYMPMYNEETGLYGWIKKHEFLAFKKWLKNRQSQCTP